MSNNASPGKLNAISPCKMRASGGESHPMTSDEMKSRFHSLEEGQPLSNLSARITQTVNTQGAWSNREEEWYFTNKRLLFSTKQPEITA
jgi:hypothetical protein